MVVSYIVDEWKWNRIPAAVLSGALVAVFGIPSALSGGKGFFGQRFASGTEPIFTRLGRDGGLNWFDTIDYLVSNVMLPLGGLLIALFASWVVASKVRKEEFMRGTAFGWVYYPWLFMLRFVVPLAIVVVFLNAIGVVQLITSAFGGE